MCPSVPASTTLPASRRSACLPPAPSRAADPHPHGAAPRRLTRVRGAGGGAGSGLAEKGREEAGEEEQGAAAAQAGSELGHGWGTVPAASESRGEDGAPLLPAGAGHAPPGSHEGARGAGEERARREPLERLACCGGRGEGGGGPGPDSGGATTLNSGLGKASSAGRFSRQPVPEVPTRGPTPCGAGRTIVQLADRRLRPSAALPRAGDGHRLPRGLSGEVPCEGSRCYGKEL